MGKLNKFYEKFFGEKRDQNPNEVYVPEGQYTLDYGTLRRFDTAEKIELPSTLKPRSSVYDENKKSIANYFDLDEAPNLKELVIPLEMTDWARHQLKDRFDEIVTVKVSEEYINKTIEQLKENIDNHKFNVKEIRVHCPQEMEYPYDDGWRKINIPRDACNHPEVKKAIVDYVMENNDLSPTIKKLIQESDNYLDYVQKIVNDKRVNYCMDIVTKELEKNISERDGCYQSTFKCGTFLGDDKTVIELKNRLVDYITENSASPEETRERIKDIYNITDLINEYSRAEVIEQIRSNLEAGRTSFEGISHDLEDYFKDKVKDSIQDFLPQSIDKAVSNIDSRAENFYEGIDPLIVKDFKIELRTAMLEHVCEKYNLNDETKNELEKQAQIIQERYSYYESKEFEKNLTITITQEENKIAIKNFATDKEAIIGLIEEKGENVPDFIKDSIEVKLQVIETMQEKYHISDEELSLLRESVIDKDSSEFYRQVEVMVDIYHEEEESRTNTSEEDIDFSFER